MSVTVSVCFCSLFSSKKSLICAVTLSVTEHSDCAQSLRWFSVNTVWQDVIYISPRVTEVSAQDWHCFGSAFQSVRWGCLLFLRVSCCFDENNLKSILDLSGAFGGNVGFRGLRWILNAWSAALASWIVCAVLHRTALPPSNSIKGALCSFGEEINSGFSYFWY